MPRHPVVLVQTAIGDYRQRVMEALVDAHGPSFQAFAGDQYFDPSTVTRVAIPGNLTTVTNVFMLGRRALLQPGVLRPGVQAGVAILELNPRILNTWIVCATRAVLRRPTVLWGHAWPRAGEASKTKILRWPLWRMANVILVYTHEQADQIRPHLPEGTRVAVAPNALYSRAEIAPAVHEEPTDFIMVSRMVASKKPDLALRAFAQAVPDLPAESRLLMIGDGPERAGLQRLAQTLGVEDRVRFPGHVGDRSILRDYYSGSVAALSPGYVGLSITQALSFGVPLIYARDEPHSPEIEAAREGFNSLAVPSDDVAALAEAMADMAHHRGDWNERRPSIAADCADRYSVEAMADGIQAAIALAEGVSS